MMQTLRELPIRIRPLEGETEISYLHRLANANALSEANLWSHLRGTDPSLPFKPTAGKAPYLLEAVGGLEDGWFLRSRTRNLLPRRCPHANWKFNTCTVCCRPPAEQPACRRCAHGGDAVVQHRAGPICTKHRQWRYNELDVNIAAVPEYVRAELALRKHLTTRGIGLETGELQLASHLLRDWAKDAGLPSLTERRTALTGTGTPEDPADFFWIFPEAVRVTEVLTDPLFLAYLLDDRWTRAHQAEYLTSVIAIVVDSQSPAHSLPAADTIIHHVNEAIRAAHGMVGTRRTSRACTMRRALVAAARTHRACLLRHLDSKNVRPNPPPPRSSPAPRTRDFAAAEHLPDLPR